MKKQLSIIFLLMLAMTVSAAKKQQDGLFKNDPNVRIGQLKNGLTYYIRHNEDPKDRAYFYIAQKVGAIQEEPHQRGLAHFLEHMCFNGTTHFPGASLRTWLETIGVKFGADLNAYTAVDETVYNIDNVPTIRESILDSCLLILHDWSHDLLLEGDEIDSERGVIQEEWRTRNSASQRMNEKIMPVLHAGSKYSDAMPIGSMDIVMNFPHQALRDYYVKWYRPDLQGVVVVGDIDVDQMEQKIKKTFADIPKPKKNAAKREYYPVPDNNDVIYFVGKDKELSSPMVQFYFKHPATPRDQKNSREHMLQGFYNGFIYNTFHDHTLDLVQAPGSPFSMGYIRDGAFFLAQTVRSLNGIVSCHSGKDDIMRGTEAFLRELFRVRQHGFAQTEFDRYRKDMLVSLDRQLKEKDKRFSKNFVNEYVRHFLDNDPIPELEDEIAFWKTELPKLTVNDLNQYFFSLFDKDGKNMAIIVTGPDKDDINYPTKEQMMALYNKVANERLEAYVDKVNNLPFLPKEPTPGKIVSESTDAEGYINMVLSNGMKVVVKKTDLKKDQILMSAASHMGLDGIDDITVDEYRQAQSMLNMMMGVNGMGNYNLMDMNKKFTGVNARVQPGFHANQTVLQGSCAPKDLAVMLEMTHAGFLYPNRDDNAFGALRERIIRTTRDSEGKPNSVLGDSTTVTLYGNNPYAKRMTVKDYEAIDFGKMMEIYKRCFSDASQFTMHFVGNVEMDELRPLLEKYIASLPATHQEVKLTPKSEVLPGSRTCMFEKEQETPTCNINIQYIAPGEFSFRNQQIASLLGQVLTIIYTKTIREEAGAAYSVGAGCSVSYYPKEKFRLSVRFPTSPESRDLAIRLVDEGIDELIKNGPNMEDINKAKEYLLKIDKSNRTVNEYWLDILGYRWNHGYDKSKGFEQLINSITAKDIQDMAKRIKAGDRIAVVMSTPKK